MKRGIALAVAVFLVVVLLALALERLDRLMGLVRQVSAGTDGMIRKRLDIQLSLWEKAKDVIATGELID